MKKNCTRVASLVLAVMMVISLLPAGVLASETGETVTLTGTISFPEDAYLDGELTIDIYARGDKTDTQRYWRDWAYDLSDIPFAIEFPADESLVSINVQVSNTYETKTNLYTSNNGAGGFVLTDNGMDPKGDMYSSVNLFSFEEIAAADIVIPTGKEVSGTITGENLQVVDGEFLTIWFGDNYFTRAYIDSETHEYKTVLPYGITAGEYTPYIAKGTTMGEKQVFESAASNILFGTYSSETVTVNPAADLEGVDFTVDTGYALSGEVKFPETGGFEYYNFEPILNFGNTEYIINTAYTGISYNIPYMIAVPKSEPPVSDIFNLHLYGYEDEVSGNISMSNIEEGDYYYSASSSNGTVRDDTSATELTITEDTEAIDFYLDAGAACMLEMTMPEGASDRSFWFDFYVLCGDETYKTSGRYEVDEAENIITFVVPKSFIGQDAYYMYKIQENMLSEDSTLYDGEVYLRQDGSVVKTQEEAMPITVTEDNAMTFEFLEKENSGTDIPAVPDVTEEYTVNFTIKDEETSEGIPGATVVVTETGVATAAGTTLTANDYGWATGTFAAGSYTVTVTADGYYPSSEPFEASMNNQTVSVDLQKKDTTPVLTEAFFVVIDKDTQDKIPNAQLSINLADATTTANAVNITTGEDVGYAFAELAEGIYSITTSADGYSPDTRRTEIYGTATEITIELEKETVTTTDNTTFYVKSGDVENTPAISGASLTIEDASGEKLTAKTNSSGKATFDLDDGEYYVTAIADGYQTRSFKIERSDTKNEFTVYLNSDDIVTVTSTVKELTKDEIVAAGISVDANKQVYNQSVVLSFMPSKTISYYYTDDGTVVKGETVTQGNTSVTPVGRDIYLIVKSSTTWLKEIFEVQIVCANSSAVETVKNLTADLTIPNGLSLAVMEGDAQTGVAALGNIAPKANVSHKWYICGDEAGDYKLSGTLTGTRDGGDISEDINLTFGIEDSISVLAGDAMTLSIEAESTAYAGSPYKMRYTLENVSGKTLYDLAFTVFGGKFFEDYDVEAAEYAREYGPDALTDENLDGEGFLFETEEFAPGAKISGVFTITFGKDLALGDNSKWILTDAFVVTGAGSTTEIPTTVTWISSLPVHNWNEGEITKAPTCTKDGVMTYKCTDIDCNETYTEAIPATGHNMGDFVTTDPTCTKDGSMVSKCQNTGCDHSTTLPIAALGHDWEDKYTTDKEANCTEDGSKSIHCTRCSEKKDVTTVPALSHDMGDWTIVTPAGCETTGQEKRVCSRGDYSETRDIPAKDHDWDDGTVTTAPTEEKEGERTYNCKNGCGKTKTEPIDKLVPQDVYFITGDITCTYGTQKTVSNEAYNDSENGGALSYTSSDETVATVNETGTVTIVGAGETTITATAAATEKYSETSASYKFVVKKAPLTVKPKKVDIFYGEEAVFSEVEGEGFVYGEDVSVLEGSAVFATDYKAADNAGEYAVTVSGITAKNYEITFATGVLNVKKAEKFEITLSMLSYRKGDEIKVKAEIAPADATAELKLEYSIGGEWTENLPTEIGTYKVRASLVKSDNIAVPDPQVYTEAELEIKAGAMITVGGEEFGIGMETDPEKGTVEFTANDETVEKVIENVPSSGEVVIDASGSTKGINTLVLPENIVKALDESDKVDSFTVIADDAEISMDADVLSTVAKEMEGSSTLSVHIDAVDKSELNEKQQAALDAISAEAHVIQLNLVVTNYDENGKETGKEIHELRGKVDIKAEYKLPDNMDGKRIVVCYVSDNGKVTYKRAEYKDGFVHFTTDHFSHYAIMATACPHDWDDGTVITPATTVAEGLMRYTCLLCDDTKDEPIPKKSTSTGNGGGLSAGGDKSTTGKDNLGTDTEKDTETQIPDGAVSEAVRFVDLGAHAWAEDAINALADAGIIRGTSANTFSPAANITRADFAILLVRAFNLESTNTENFADVAASDYFAPELAIARNTGIVGGIGNNKYAPRNAITRQDMMVIVYRALEASLALKGVEPSNDGGGIQAPAQYPDFDSVSVYARDAVSALTGAGLINGKNGRIAPTDYTTRAEVAVLLQRILEYVK